MPILVLNLFMFSAFAEEFCFNSPEMATRQHYIWESRTKALTIKFLQLQRPVSPVQSKVNYCTGCLELTGDSYIIGIHKEEFEEKIRQIIPEPLDKEVDLPVDVSIGGLLPKTLMVNDYIGNPLYRPKDLIS